MSEGTDQADRISAIRREIVAIFTGDAPRVDAEGRDRYLMLICDLGRLREEAEREGADRAPCHGGEIVRQVTAGP
jgi:hypothetical protein